LGQKTHFSKKSTVKKQSLYYRSATFCRKSKSCHISAISHPNALKPAQKCSYFKSSFFVRFFAALGSTLADASVDPWKFLNFFLL